MNHPWEPGYDDENMDPVAIVIWYKGVVEGQRKLIEFMKSHIDHYAAGKVKIVIEDSLWEHLCEDRDVSPN